MHTSTLLRRSENRLFKKTQQHNMSLKPKYPIELYAIVRLVYPQHNVVTSLHIPLVSVWDPYADTLPTVLSRDLRMACQLLYGKHGFSMRLNRTTISTLGLNNLSARGSITSGKCLMIFQPSTSFTKDSRLCT